MLEKPAFDEGIDEVRFLLFDHYREDEQIESLAKNEVYLWCTVRKNPCLELISDVGVDVIEALIEQAGITCISEIENCSKTNWLKKKRGRTRKGDATNRVRHDC